MLRYYVLIYLYVILGICGFYKIAAETPVTFAFKEYQYKDSPKNEMTFREFETACEQSSVCSHLNGLQRTRCVRECVSPSCYRELYQADQLEEGEIDVRLNSFKGCFIQRSGRTRN
ncbi:uncharacterized protein LOC131849781 [Achroia grisella]|uniref:uncharacterized protein LOC131849781 n=1 Tax=Achroia grisella TaxID=688607 RepID=UPI0027D20060|nr:uncharacterized protein LOC131849781 [Achroia grisella]XP_059055884.1 uncharacterized protein LOC131849781 [Achroia grisella]